MARFDFSSGSTYFVTNCTHQRAHLFGEVYDSVMYRSSTGNLVQAAWERMLTLRQEVVPHAFVVMPNHFHALFSMDLDALRNNPDASPGLDALLARIAKRPYRMARRRPDSVATIIGGFMDDATRAIRRLSNDPELVIWQEPFHEHLVRDERQYETIRQYIETNPESWHKDRYASDANDLSGGNQ